VSEPFLGEIRVFSFNFVPRGWATCSGQLLPINQNQALFALLGTTYGGNGQTTFALPDLRGRTAVEPGTEVILGEQGGAETHTLTAAEAGHALGADVAPGTNRPAGALLARGGAYADSADTPGVLSGAGGGQPHENRAPYLALTYAIALQGIFPSQN
jgi:microcystin-dependent protein